MPSASQVKQLEMILRTELRAYAKAYRTVQFALYGLPIVLVVAALLYLLLRWTGHSLYELHAAASAWAYVLAGFVGYAWWAFRETASRAGAVSMVKELAEMQGLKVIHWPTGKGITGDTVELVGADFTDGKPVDWMRKWGRWDCLADLI